MNDVRLKISSPWVTYVNEIKALFGNDSDINIVYDNREVEVKLYVEDAKKAWAIDMLLPDEKQFGNITLYITVVPPNDAIMYSFDNNTVAEIFDIAFRRNPAYAFSYSVDDIFSNEIVYIVFKNKVVQFFNDNLNDLYGNISTLYQEIAKDILNNEVFHSVFFCTDVEEKVGRPKEEWLN